ncbi:OTU-like cysteine protease family protein [Galdieria sulphuraria]|uniref:OTU-like cysteine protease family protein n=1 Tax=Galdieria sulphuraria TaxID=130081 RepID=M2Y2B4_GALSU|nr:OTU-like cysteine protease family protein [Galdieria sulphuraria]EME29949.1 OTU-like cysteine protease family protein [Galdieria sulphuraria]|eukprot:XP_005706469.1 OTU-like cysteine protease family protein [Galdieria sulphuraria]
MELLAVTLSQKRTNRQRIWEDIDEEKTQFKRLMLSELRDRGFMESDAAQLYEKQFQETVNSTTPRTATEDNPSFYRTVKKRNIVKLANPAVDSPKVVMSRGEEEWKRITELLCSKDLKIYEVVADGDCLFRAFAHQLERCTGEKYSVLQLRQLVASTIWKEKDRYLPFLTEEEGVAYHENIERYCSDLEERKLWGGELELKVLSEIFSVPIQRR